CSLLVTIKIPTPAGPGFPATAASVYNRIIKSPILFFRKNESMNNKNIKPLKLNISFELAYEVISYSIFVIFICLSYVFVSYFFVFIFICLVYVFSSNLLSFNWYTVIFVVLAIFLYILKRKSYLLIEKDVLSIYYFYFFKKKKIEMKTIDEFVFYKSSRKVEIRSNNQTILIIYLKDKKKRKLLDWLVQHYPNIPCLFFSENETIG